MHWLSFIAGVVSAFGMSVAFLIFAMWHNKRYPLVKPEPEEQILAAETTIHCPPAYGLRVVK